MEEDLSKLEASMASTERLIQRLVVLFERNMKDGLVPVEEALKSATTSLEGAAQESERLRKSAAKHKAVSSKVADSAEKAEASTKTWVDTFNHAVDGSRRMEASSRQAINTFSNLSSTIVSSFTRLELGSTQAAAASKGLLSAGQWAAKSANYLNSAARNITQFGPVVGGIVSSFDIITDMMAVQRRRMEVAVGKAVTYSELESNNQRELAKIREAGLTSAQADLDQAIKDQKDAEDRAEALRRRKSELATALPQIVTSLIDEPAIGSNTRQSYSEENRGIIADLEAQQERVNIDVKNLEALAKRIREATDKRNQEQLKYDKDNALQRQILDGRIALADLSVGNDTKNYEEIKRKIEEQEQLLSSGLYDGRDAEIITAIIDGRRRWQEAEIASIQLDYDNRVLFLKNNPIRDENGNEIAVAMLAAEQKLVQDLKSRLDTVKDSFILPLGVVLSPEQALNIDKQRAELKMLPAASRDKAQAMQLSLNQRAQSAQYTDAAVRTQIMMHDLELASANTNKLFQPGMIYGESNQLAAVYNSIDTLKAEIKQLDFESSKVTGESAKAILSALEKKRIDLKVLLSTDLILAERALDSAKASREQERLERQFKADATNVSIETAKINKQFERQKRQLTAAGGPEGAISALSDAAQRAEFEQQASLAAKVVKTQEEKLDAAKRAGASEETILALYKKLEDAKTKQIDLLSQQAIVLNNQALNAPFDLANDKPSLERFNRKKRLGTNWLGPAEWSGMSPKIDRGEGLGSESARLTSSFNESWRKRRGHLTDEEKDAAKQERALNLQLARARRAIDRGSGTKKQRDLVDYYNAERDRGSAKNPVGVISRQLAAANKYLAAMAGLPETGDEK